MNKIQILVDSCADLTLDMLSEHGIDYVKMNTVADGVETPAALDFAPYTPKSFYDLLRQGKRVTTTQVPPSEFEAALKST